MKINGLQPQQVYKIFEKDVSYVNRAEGKTDSGEYADSLEISKQSADLSEARGLACDAGLYTDNSADREAKIENLKSLVEQGQYSIPAKDVANSILSGRSTGEVR